MFKFVLIFLFFIQVYSTGGKLSLLSCILITFEYLVKISCYDCIIPTATNKLPSSCNTNTNCTGKWCYRGPDANSRGTLLTCRDYTPTIDYTNGEVFVHESLIDSYFQGVNLSVQLILMRHGQIVTVKTQLFVIQDIV